jgi:hypothetical protein
MATTTMNPPLGWHIRSEGAGYISRETVTIASGEGVLKAGAVLGKTTASGKYAWYDNAASDGTQAAAAVLFGEVDATSADVKAVVHVRLCEIETDRLVWITGADSTAKTAGLADLAAAYVVAR